MKRRTYVVLGTALFFGSMLGADCDGDIVADPTFRDWCGASLCSWTTDHGAIKQAPTWSPDDLGVDFETQGTEISQVTNESQATCITFTTVADIDPDAQMTLSVDFDNDGSIDFTRVLDAAYWEQDVAVITAPKSYAGITFHITKEGTGTAVLAEMRIQSTTGCSAAAAPLKDLGLGEACDSDAKCGSGLTCTDDSPWYNATCGECSPSLPCANGATCERRAANLPLQCGPGAKLGVSGAPCLAGDDCKSGVCHGVSDEGPDGGRITLDGGLVLDGGVALTGDACSLDAGPDASAGCYARPSQILSGTCQ